jgi:hypothetical protein
MIRVLLLIAVAGFFVGVAALGGAAAVGGPELASRKWEWFADWDDHHDGRFERGRGWDHDDDDRERIPSPKREESNEASRELAWDGSTRALFDIPASIEFVQAAGPGKVTITGPKDLVDQVQLSGGRLSLAKSPPEYVRLRVVMTAPSVTAFEVGGDDRLEIRDYKQDRLAISASGSAEVLASGQARELSLDISGSGEADLADLVSDAAKAEVSGAAEAVIAPREAADLDISGSGSVRLVTRPKRLETDVTGAGSIIFDDGSRASDASDRKEQRRGSEA